MEVDPNQRGGIQKIKEEILKGRSGVSFDSKVAEAATADQISDPEMKRRIELFEYLPDDKKEAVKRGEISVLFDTSARMIDYPSYETMTVKKS